MIKQELNEPTTIADAMIDIGRSEGKAEGRAEEREAIDNQMDEALKANPTMSLAEFKKQFSNEQKEN